MKRTILFLLISAAFLSCKKGDTGPQGPPGSNNPAPLPVACFTVNDTLSLDSTHVFSFTNCSQNAVRYEWDFDDFNYAPVANPNHVYNEYGIFTVRMTAYNADDVSSQASQAITIVDSTPPPPMYRLRKIEYHQVYSLLTFPLTLIFYNSNFNVTNSISFQSQLPYTSLLADSSIYDSPGPTITYNLRTIDTSGHNYNRTFPVAVSSIVNDRFDTSFVLSGDTTAFSLYFSYH
jgi:PKD repeat protein